MSIIVFPALLGLSWPVKRFYEWQTNKQQSVSGKKLRIAEWSYPMRHWELGYDVIRSGGSFTDLANLRGFFMARKGAYDSFLYQDDKDNAVTAQALSPALGDGVNRVFQLQGTFDTTSYGGWTEPIYAPNVISAVKVGGTPTVAYTYTDWSSSTPGQITFTVAPSNGAAITADFSFYFPAQFDDDLIEFNEFMLNLHDLGSVKFSGIK